MSNQNLCEKILFSKEQILNEVNRLGMEITKDYEGKEVVFVSVLTGAFMFVADLVRSVQLTSYLDFMQVSTYENSTQTSGNFVVKKDLTSDIRGKDVIIVEDIIDTGITMDKVMELLRMRGAKSVRLCACLSKPERRKVDVKIDYLGFEVPDEFVIGYGLDVDEKYRNLPYIGVVCNAD